MTIARQWAARWADGRNRTVPAATVAHAILDIELKKKDACEASDLVNEARPNTSPLHPLFEWDDSVAAERFREEQARHIIRNVRFTSIPANDEPAITKVAFISIGSGYRNIDAVLRSKPLREKMLEDARNQLKAWDERFGHLSELAVIRNAIRGLPD